MSLKPNRGGRKKVSLLTMHSGMASKTYNVHGRRYPKLPGKLLFKGALKDILKK